MIEISQKYEMGKLAFFVDNSTPRFPEVDKELDRELRNRKITALVTQAVKDDEKLSYGDIRLIADNDSTEKEYGREKSKSCFTR